MSLCRQWMETVLIPGTIYPIAIARFLYNGNAVGEGTVTAKVSYNSAIPAYDIELTITDSTTNTYSYNAIAILDTNGNTIALFTYSQAYSKGTGALTVNETIEVQDFTPPVQFVNVTLVDWNQALANAIVNGGTVPQPNIVLIIDTNGQAILQQVFSPSFNFTANSIQEYQTITCQQCSSLSGLYFVLGYLDQSTNTLYFINSLFFASGFIQATFTWQIPFNPNC